MSFLTGKPAKSTSSSSSSNVNNGLLTDLYTPTANAGNGATNYIQSILMGGGSTPDYAAYVQGNQDLLNDYNTNYANNPNSPYADMAAYGQYHYDTYGKNEGRVTPTVGSEYQNYLQMAGYAPAMKQLSQAVVGQGAASGLLRSGSTAKALQSQGTTLNNQYFSNYLQQLAGLSGLGLQAGNIISGAGQQSSSTGTSSGATGGLIGGISQLGSAASGIAGAIGAFKGL